MTYTNKTQPTKISPTKFLKENYKGKEKVESEALILVDLYSQATGSPCVMWNKIFGFGKYIYKDSKGNDHEYLVIGFAISTTGFTLYNMIGWDHYKKDLENLGTYRLSGKSCLFIKSISKINTHVLKKIIHRIVHDMKKKYEVYM